MDEEHTGETAKGIKQKQDVNEEKKPAMKADVNVCTVCEVRCYVKFSHE